MLVDFWAPWCAPCRALAPGLDDLAQDYADEASIVKVKVNVEAEPAIAIEQHVSVLPTMVLFRDGEETERIAGLWSRSRIARLLDNYL